MQSVTELIVRIADLCEAEGRALRAMSIRLALGVAIILVSAAALAAGVALLLGAVFFAIQAQTGTTVAALITGVLALGTGATLAWLGRRIAK